MATIDLELAGLTGKDAFSLSGVSVAGSDHLFVAPDEGGSVLRLGRHGDGYRLADSVAVSDVVEVAGEPGGEIDVEGLDVADGLLWLVGSHSAVRPRIKKSVPDDEVPGLLAVVKRPAARRLLARIPLVDTGHGPQLVSSAERVDGSIVTAASLVADGLHSALQADPHIGPFLALPGKDNGLDIEGIAIVGDRVLLGLRGPVLRGWAVLLEITPRAAAATGRLEIGTPITHFLDLEGLGIRDLARHGDDLLVLAGPTMVLDGPSRVLRIRGACSGSMPVVVRSHDLERLGPDLAVGVGEDHPEGITVLDRAGGPRLLVIADSPARTSVHGSTIRAVLLPLN